MVREVGLRERKKEMTRQHIADTAARLFATAGYDDVSVVDVARAAEVSDQTVYNYFPAKQDLVLDRADEIVSGTPRPSSTDRAARVRPLRCAPWRGRTSNDTATPTWSERAVSYRPCASAVPPFTS